VFQFGGANRRPLDAGPFVTRRLLFFISIAAAAFAPTPSAAQSAEKGDVVKPPPGMCRIWVDGVPKDKQPAPTDCASALKNKPTNGRVIFGDAKPAVSPPPPTGPTGRKSPPDTAKSKSRPRRGDSTSARRSH
jgi:hypothetical protein